MSTGTKALYDTHRAGRGDGIGMRCLAGPYARGEQWMIDRVLADLARGGIAHEVRLGVYFNAPDQAFVWRAAEGWLTSDEAKLEEQSDVECVRKRRSDIGGTHQPREEAAA